MIYKPSQAIQHLAEETLSNLVEQRQNYVPQTQTSYHLSGNPLQHLEVETRIVTEDNQQPSIKDINASAFSRVNNSANNELKNMSETCTY